MKKRIIQTSLQQIEQIANFQQDRLNKSAFAKQQTLQTAIDVMLSYISIIQDNLK